MPSHSRLVEVNIPEAILLADLYEIAFDLDAVERYCLRLIELEGSNPRDFLTEEGLTSAAIVKYGRCFTEGVRLSLKLSDLSNLDDDDTAAHEYFLALRHKFVAHAVNAFEETYVNVTATSKDGNLMPIETVSAGQHRLVLSANEAPSLLDLARSVRAIVSTKIADEKERVLSYLQSLPAEVVHSGDLHKPGVITPQNVHRTRARGVHARKKGES